jgi:hypothetical protein
MMKRIQTIAIIAALAFVGNVQAKDFKIYAPPNFYGPWETIASHVGEVTYSVSVKPVGSTVVAGEIRFYDKKTGKQAVRSFFGSTTFTTSNSVANVEIRLKGGGLGSSCDVKVSP